MLRTTWQWLPFDSSDNAVATPTVNPLWRRRTAILLRQVNTPRLMLLLVRNDTLQQARVHKRWRTRSVNATLLRLIFWLGCIQFEQT